LTIIELLLSSWIHLGDVPGLGGFEAGRQQNSGDPVATRAGSVLP
jgi:hypothetical protein